jgi:hypothetical protein
MSATELKQTGNIQYLVVQQNDELNEQFNIY